MISFFEEDNPEELDCLNNLREVEDNDLPIDMVRIVPTKEDIDIDEQLYTAYW